MRQIEIVDELDGDPAIPFERREIGSLWRSDAHVLIVMCGNGDGPEYAVAHPTGCDDDCTVSFQLSEGGHEQPPSYPQVPTEPGMYLVRAESVKGGWVHGSFPVDHDCYLTFEEELKGRYDDSE